MLIIDKARDLNPEALESLRMLSDDEVVSDKQKCGIFNAPVPRGGESSPPALVIYDRELVKELI
ncbi:MAG: hypothetical protein KJ558_00865 [Gammaproteobacteria bacterium]|nr:hypothetical protein [Gammaproteobacteria bacterium]MBU1653387.1 hypothetical protein [Gammaproteobacteria bacterium]MBU1960840.1 hypothetical protein [Gammaproteobacteria bacterium]